MRMFCIGWMLAVAAWGQSARPLTEYPVHASTEAFDVGVDYTVHSFSGNTGTGPMYLAQEYLVFEVAFFPRKSFESPVGSFELTINSSKNRIQQAEPGVVALSLRRSDWNDRPRLNVDGSAGDANVVLGRPTSNGRFPGDPEAQRRLPAPPRAPQDPHAISEPVVDPAAILIGSALKAGPIRAPTVGNVYFPWNGNAAKIKHLVLRFVASGEKMEVIVR